MQKRHILVLMLCFLCSGCAAINAPYYSPDVAKDSGKKLVTVQYFDVTGGKNLYKGNSDFSIIIAEYLAGALQEKGLRALAVDRGNPQTFDGYRVRGEITKLYPGNWQGRVWVGSGLGRAHILVQAVLTRVGDNTELARAEEEASSTSFQSAESILRSVCARVSRAIADKFYTAITNDKK